MEAEEFEHIPWSTLVAADDRSRLRMYYLAAGVVVAVALGFAVARLVTANPQVGPATGETFASTTLEAPVVTTSVVPPPTTALVADTPPITAAVDAPALYSEADLMAVAPDAAEATATMRAEWFVTDFFTIDGDGANRSDVDEALPARVPQAPDAGAASYVEWARTHHVEPLGGGRFKVTVAFRSIAAPPGGEYRRQPVRAVDVVVAVDGPHAAVEDLPAPADAPEWFEIEPHSGLGEGDLALAPPEAVATAVAQAREWGESASPLSASPTANGWRIVVMVEDTTGASWPMAIDVGG